PYTRRPRTQPNTQRRDRLTQPRRRLCPHPLRRPRSHLDSRKAPQPIRPRLKHRRLPREPQPPRRRILPLPPTISLHLCPYCPFARPGDMRRDLEPLLEAPRRTVPRLTRELDRPHEPPVLPTKLPLDLELASTHLVHQFPIQCLIIELGKDRRPHQRERNSLGHLAIFVEELVGPLEGPRLPEPPAVRREARP